MQRLLFERLKEWRKEKKRKPLVLKGVRQSGKTFLLKEFGEKCFKKTHYLNFEKEPALSELFSSSLSPKAILEKLSFHLNTSIDVDEDLVIFDEIQECPYALTSLKYFCEELPQLTLCAAGSLLGLHLNEASFPVGKVTFETLRPLNFEEFLMASQDKSLSFFQNFGSNSSIQAQAHEHLMLLLKHYFVVGGLPEAVLTYLENKEDLFEAFQKVRKKQQDLIHAYYADIAKHAGKANAMHIDRILRSIPALLEKEYDGSTKRFKFKGVIPKVSHYDRLARAIDWLEMTGLILKIHTLNTARVPLKGYIRESFFKLFLFDVGLLGAMVDLDPKTILDYAYGSYKGYFAEVFVAQEMVSTKEVDLFSWQEKQSELEFLQEFEGQLVPIEVKSGPSRKASSLKVFSQKYHPKKQVMISADPLESAKDLKIQKVPLYWASKWRHLVAL